MNVSKKTLVFPFASGLLFALGLTASGMTQPGTVMNFLDFTGSWDPSLALVMACAIGTYAPLRWLITSRGTKATDPPEKKPTEHLDRPLLVGAALFGVGWGLAGYCPGPALASLGTFSASIWVFLAALLTGMALHSRSLGTAPS